LRGLLRYNKKKTFSSILIHQAPFALIILLFVQYIGISQELQGSESPPGSWPKEGTIEFEHVTLRYKPDLPPSLSDVSFLISSGMQV
jgi:ABC-type multidrug transport system fused ATPase/permease subunit